MAKKKVFVLSIFLIVVLAVVAVVLFSISEDENSQNTATSTSLSAQSMANWAMRAYDENWEYVYGGNTPGAVDAPGLICSYVACPHNVEAMLAASAKTGSITLIPETPGLGLYTAGHVGVYVGNGMFVDVVPDVGARLLPLSSFRWTMWFEIPNVNYD